MQDGVVDTVNTVRGGAENAARGATRSPVPVGDPVASDLAIQVAGALEDERRRIARGLHDDVGQSLAAACMHLHELRHTTGEPERGAIADDVERLIRHAIDALRALTFDLRCPAMPEEGIGSVLAELAERFACDHHLECVVHVEETPRIDERAAEVLYLVTRELLHNIAKHAAATAVAVEVRAGSGGVEVSVADDGRGMGTDGRSPGFGLLIARERLAAVAGGLSITSGAEGTSVSARVPAATDGALR